jgi:predicted RNA-binding protein with PUA-like domain
VAVSYWLIKQEPADYSWDTFVRDKHTQWTGVRNFQARNHLRAMAVGDLALFYHSGAEKQAVGVAQVSRAAFPDPTAKDGDWSAVEVIPVKPLKVPVPLSAIKSDPAFRDMPLLRQSRLSVSPVTRDQFRRIVELGQTKL